MEPIIAILQHHGLLAVFLTAFVESVGLPVPAYPVLIVAAALAPSLGIFMPELFTVTIAANLIPDAGWYAAGRRYGTRIMGALCKISISPDSCARGSSDMFIRHGAPVLAVIKFIPGFGNLGIVIAGATHMKQPKFWFFDTIGALIYVGVGLGLGIAFRGAIDNVLHNLAAFGRWSLIGIVVVFALYLLSKYLQRKWLLHRLRMDRITVEELSDLLKKEMRPIILDVRPAVQREQEGIIPGALLADPQKIDVTIENPQDGREIIVYCSCPNEVSAARLAKRLRHNGFKKIRPLLGGIDAWVRAGYAVDRLPGVAA